MIHLIVYSFLPMFIKQQPDPFKFLSAFFACFLITELSCQAQIASDGTLPTKVTTPDRHHFTVTQGSQVGKNLFHSFRKFSVPAGGSVFFDYAPDVRYIFSRVTGKSISRINGLIQTPETSNADFFLINPNGIVFGPQAQLDVGGSFIASTADRINFADGTSFGVSTATTEPLLTVSVPIGLQFGSESGSILNQSQFRRDIAEYELGNQRVGLEVKSGNTLALVANNIEMNNRSTLFSLGGKITLGSVADNSFVSLTPDEAAGWSLGYEGTQEFRDIHFSQNSFISTFTAVNGGDVQLQGRQITTTQNSGVGIINLSPENAGGALNIIASESVELKNSDFTNATFAPGAPGDIFIQTKHLVVDSSFIDSNSNGASATGGNIVINATESLVAKNSGTITAKTYVIGQIGGNITINTGELYLDNSGFIEASSLYNSEPSQAGNISITARTVQLSRGSAIVATNDLGNGGNINLQVTDTLLLRNQSRITATSSGQESTGGNGGNITIDAGFVITTPLENNDITANALGGQGGVITINTRGIVGFTVRTLEDLRQALGTEVPEELDPQNLVTSDITAISQTDPNLAGQVTINISDVNPEQELTTLSTNVVDVSGLIAQGCAGATTAQTQSRFVITGRGGLPTAPDQALRSDAVIVDLVALEPETTKIAAKTIPVQLVSKSQQTAAVPATGWIIDGDQVTLTSPTTAIASTTSSPSLSGLAACHVP